MLRLEVILGRRSEGERGLVPLDSERAKREGRGFRSDTDLLYDGFRMIPDDIWESQWLYNQLRSQEQEILMSDVIGQDVKKVEKVDRAAEAKQRILDEKELQEQNAEAARVERVKHDIAENYWSRVRSIFLNDIECDIKQVDATGGAMNVATSRGEVKAKGGEFIVTLPDGDLCVMSAAAVRMLDLASGAVHIVLNRDTGEVEELPVPFGYPNFDESLLDPPDDVEDVEDGDLPVTTQGASQHEPTLSELQKSDKKKFDEDEARKKQAASSGKEVKK
jgi:hypothetical protein